MNESLDEQPSVLELVRIYFDVENIRSQEERNDAEAALKNMLKVPREQ